MSRKTHLFCDRLLWVLFLGVFIIWRKLPLLVRMNFPSESDSPQAFDVFLCYNSEERAAVREIARKLRDRGISYWLDEEQLLPGRHWREIQERDMSQFRSVAIFIGRHGIGKWQRLEISIFLQQFVESQIPIIPIFLPDAPPETELLKFLRLFTWIDFRLADPDPMVQFVNGITRHQPNLDPGLITQTKRVFSDETQINIPNNLTQEGAVAFIGRVPELSQLKDLLSRKTSAAICAVYGMGGIGKTELALQFAYQERDRQTYPGGIVWLDARQDMRPQIISFARFHLDLQPPSDLELNDQICWCWQHWRSGKALLVLDDVQDYADVEALNIPGRSEFQRLITTRKTLGASVRTLPLEPMSESAALELLRSLVWDGRIDRELLVAKEVCGWLGYLPLGMELVGRYLFREPDVTVAKLWERLQDKRLEAKALKDREAGITSSLGVAATFELSWQELPTEGQRLAALLSLFAPVEIPWRLVQESFPELNEEALKDLRDEKLISLNLLRRTDTEQYQLDPLLREFFAAKRQQMPEEEAMKQSLCLAMVAMANQIPDVPTLFQLEQIKPVIPHLQEVSTTLHAILSDSNLTALATCVARFYKGQAAYVEAEYWYNQCLALATAHLGEEHPETAISLNGLAGLYQLQGRNDEAEILYRRSLQIFTAQLGEDHPAKANSLSNLAELYRSQGRNDEAEILYWQSLQIREIQLGADHSDTASSLDNLAALYSYQKRFAEAEPLLERALTIRELKLGLRHLDTERTWQNLVNLRQIVGRDSQPSKQRIPQSNEQRKPLKVFFSYSRVDKVLRDKLQTHLSPLKRQDLIAFWHDRNISAGSKWKEQIDNHIQTADIILLLISPHFIESEYCYETELPLAMERHELDKTCVIPILLRPVSGWQNLPFAILQIYPSEAKPITRWENEDEAFVDVADGIRDAIQLLME